MGTLIPIRLLARQGLYNEGEVAGFEPDTAAALIASGRAEAYVADGDAPAASETEQETEQEGEQEGEQEEDPDKRQESRPDAKPGKRKKA